MNAPLTTSARDVQPAPGAEPSTAPAPPQRSWSLRKRLLWLSELAIIFALLTGGVSVLIAAHIESDQSYDEQLEDIARVILRFSQHEIEEILADGRTDMIHEETAATLDRRYAYQVWSPKGELLLVSHAAPREPFAPLDSQGFSDRVVDGKEYCIYTLRNDPGTMLIQVAEDESQRGFLTPSLYLFLVALFFASAGLLLLLNRWTFRRAMRALSQSAQQLTNRSPQNLRPVQTDDPPLELQPLLSSVNCLFGRIERTLDAERHFTAAAAHELRTPLAAVRIQAQVVDRARSAQEARKALESLVACVDRASRMIDQLLTLAHVESVAPHSGAFKELRLDFVVQQVVEDLAPALEAANVRVELQLEPVTLSAIEFAVAAMVRNLIDNAARHAEQGEVVLVRTRARKDEVVLTVEDGGPGIPEEERARVCERFYRLPDSTTDGCGVGLSIVQSVVDAHHARLVLGTSTLGGLLVTVTFPQT